MSKRKFAVMVLIVALAAGAGRAQEIQVTITNPDSGQKEVVTWASARAASDDWWDDASHVHAATMTMPLPLAPVDRIDLPGGKTLDLDGEFFAEFKGRMKAGAFFVENAGIAPPVKFDDRKNIVALVTTEHGKFTGPLLTFSGGRTIAMAMVYDAHDERTGPMLMFRENEKPLLFGQWRKNQRHGWFALFDANGRAELLARYSRDKLTEAYLIKDAAIGEKLNRLGEPDFGGPLAHAMGKLNGELDDIKRNEKESKKALADWDMAIRRMIVADQAVEKRQNIIARGRADNTGFINSLMGMATASPAGQARSYLGPVVSPGR